MQEYDGERRIMRVAGRTLRSCIVASFLGFLLLPWVADASEGWLYFGRDKSSENTKYYYGADSVRYASADHVSAWMKIRQPSGDQILETEINCSGRLFRVLRNPTTDFWETLWQKPRPIVTQYVVSGWLEIPPDSEMSSLRKILCNNPQKDWH
ncbi:MAG TPA: hypothetical protein DCZ04_13670 [Syntrophorhabdus aromaticivorans]|nr:hypothetical protein [Syntrophorhabdus aromaticivorans]